MKQQKDYQPFTVQYLLRSFATIEVALGKLFVLLLNFLFNFYLLLVNRMCNRKEAEEPQKYRVSSE